MRRRTLLTVCLATGVALFLIADASGAVVGFATGNNWLKLPKAERVGYVAGVMDSLLLVASLDTSQAQQFRANSLRLIECLKTRPEVTMGQLEAVVLRFRSLHPEAWDSSMAVLVVGSLRDFCPSRR